MKTNYINVKQQFFILSLTIATVISLAWISPEKKQVLKVKKEKSLSQIKAPATEAKPLKSHLVVKADTDTTKMKKNNIYFTTNQNGTRITYTSLDEMPDSLRKRYLEIEKKFNSPEWKDKMAKLEKNSVELERKFNSPEWKDKMAKLEKNSIELERKFNSPEWKDKMAKLEKNSIELEKKFNSPEWKDKMAKLEKNSVELEKKFNSPEWKDKMAKLEKNSVELERKFNSPEWKQKIEDYKKLQNSPEYKELQQKFDKDIKELKKQKGIKEDKASLTFDGENLNKLFVPFAADFKSAFVATLPLQFKATDFNFEGSNLKLEKLKSLLEKFPSKTLKLDHMEIKLN